jgi:hypothetical protein
MSFLKWCACPFRLVNRAPVRARLRSLGLGGGAGGAVRGRSRDGPTRKLTSKSGFGTVDKPKNLAPAGRNRAPEPRGRGSYCTTGVNEACSPALELIDQSHDGSFGLAMRINAI